MAEDDQIAMAEELGECQSSESNGARKRL